MGSLICFDLEGSLSPQDNAYELMKLLPNGDRIFEVISRYDSMLGNTKKDTIELLLNSLTYIIRKEIHIRKF